MPQLYTGYRPVSYTHLDVYKRQMPNCSPSSPISRTSLSLICSLIINSLRVVHLQISHVVLESACPRSIPVGQKIKRTARLSTFSHKTICCPISVSYTHLLVFYKFIILDVIHFKKVATFYYFLNS